MRRYFTDDSFEDFLKQNTEQFQMRPSDRVWKGISDNLRRRNRRMGWFTGSLLLLATSAGGYYAWLQEDPPPVAPDAALMARENSSQNAGDWQQAPVIYLKDRVTAPDASPSAEPTAPALPPASEATTTRTKPQAAATAAPIRKLFIRKTASRASAAFARLSQTGEYEPAFSSNPSVSGSGITAASNRPFSLLAPLPPEAGARTEDQRMTPLANVKEGNRVSLQFFFAPTVSYRALSENRDFTETTPQNAADPNYAALYNINEAVTHKPNIGLELGMTAKYPLARNLKVQGGLQFNMSRYDVQVYDNNAPQVATMRFRDGGRQSRSTVYSNFDGQRQDWLQNTYFQVSAPIGVEVQLAGNERTQFGIASTIQPTYILNDRVYMLSTDFKNYAEVPWLIRRWNVNTAFVTYVAYSTGKLNWQVGPQVRYQLMSSFVNKYPVKENLFDFGLRVGVSLSGKQ